MGGPFVLLHVCSQTSVVIDNDIARYRCAVGECPAFVLGYTTWALRVRRIVDKARIVYPLFADINLLC